MKRYNVTVNGNTYQVEVEEVQGEFAVAPVVAPVAAPTAPAPVAAPAAPAAPAKEAEIAKPAAKVTAEGEKVTCPMPGTILKVNVNTGDTFKKGDVLFVLEAMKMENEIMAPHDGKVIQVGIAKGAAVNTGDTLAVIE